MKETKEEKEARMAKLHATQKAIFESPWEFYVEPFAIAKGIYFVGNTFVSSFLLDTGKELVLIDSGYKETFYMVLEGIRKLGFDPCKIEYLLLTHAHADHAAASRFLQEMAPARTYLGEKDMFFFGERRDLLPGPEHMPDFRIDAYYEYDVSMQIGEMRITPKFTPGHTPGCTSFLIETKDLEGNEIVCGLHGGLGINGMTDEELAANGFPMDSREQFHAALEEAMTWKVDLTLISHNLMYDMIGLAKKDDGSGKAFLNPNAWREMLQKRMLELERIM